MIYQTDQNKLKDFDERYTCSYYTWDPFFPEAERDLRFYLGDQWDEQEKRQLFQEGRSTFVFNRIRRSINLLTGYQRKNRLSSVVIPVEDSDQKVADQLSQCLLYVMNYGGGYEMISDCYGGGLKTGLNMMNVYMDYRDDPLNGDIRFSRDPYNGVILDPYFTRLDLTDCEYILRRKYLSREQVVSMLPQQEKDVDMLYKMGWERDDKFTWLPYQRQPNGQDLMAYSEMFEMKWRQVPMLVDMESGETIEFDVKDEMMTAFLKRYPQLQVIKRPKRYIEKTTIVNDQVMRTDIDPDGLDIYPMVPFVAIWEPESDQWGLKLQSITRILRDPQRESNRRRSQMTDLLDSQINSGWIAEENSVVNPRSLFQSGQGRVIWKKKNAQPGSLEKIPPAQIPPSMFQLQETFDNDMMELLGANDATFGQTENAGESGVMMMLRQGASVINLQEIMDKLRTSQKAVSQICLKLIQTWSPEKIKRIINEEPAEQFYNGDFTKYDVTVTEGMLTDTQRQMYFRQLVDLRQLGVPVDGKMLAEAAPIQGKSQLIEDIQQREQQQAQAAQQQAQIEQQLINTQSQAMQAKAISDVALGKERFTRAVANLGLEDERASAAIENRADAALQRAKAIAELQQLDDDRLIKYLNIVRMMEEMNRQKEEQIKSDDVQISARATDVPSRTTPAMPVQQQTEELPDEGQVLRNA